MIAASDKGKMSNCLVQSTSEECRFPMSSQPRADAATRTVLLRVGNPIAVIVASGLSLHLVPHHVVSMPPAEAATLLRRQDKSYF